MKLRIAFTVEVSPEQSRDLVAYAREVGLDYDNPDARTLIRRLLALHGRSALDNAPEYGQFSPDPEA